jgi:DNA polymerase Ligase (LigD)
MPRFAILDHDWPTRHWDLLLEDGDTLLSWRLLGEPRSGTTLPAERLANHRKLYLDYEGPVSDDRGSVTRWDAGTFEWITRTSDAIEVLMSGTKSVGRLRLAFDGDNWKCEAPV